MNEEKCRRETKCKGRKVRSSVSQYMVTKKGTKKVRT